MSEFDIEILEVLEFMIGNYAGVEFSKTNAEAYMAALSGTNIVRLRAAVEKLVRECKFPPRPAEILEAAFHHQSVRIEPLRDRLQELRNRFWLTEEIPQAEMDALYREMRIAGYWEMAEYLRTVQLRMERDVRSLVR